MPPELLPTSQENLYIKLNHSTLKDAVIMRAEILETVSELFKIDVFLQINKDVNLEKIIDTQATISLELEEGKKRYFSGIIEKASFENIPNVISTKTDNILFLKISPTFIHANYTRKYRSFQEKTVKDIIESVLKENSVSNVKISLTSCGTSKRIFCVQYGESDFHFISRLMEEEGIFYSFEHEDGKDTLVISDNSASVKKTGDELKIRKPATNATLTLDSLYNVSFSTSIGTKQVNSFAYVVKTAETIKGAASDTKEKYKIGNKEIFDPFFVEKPAGDKIAKTILECDNSILKTINGSGYCPYVASGEICKISGSTSTAHNGEFFMISVKHTINQISEDNETPAYHNSFVGIPSDVSFRPANVHKKNRIFGSQTAIVTGIPDEEIFCDEDAQVKVKFHWDSQAEKNEKSSCWIRVAQSWAGSKFGGLVIPRIDMEVLVTFINGDPDQPLITGCVYNGINKPPANYPKEKNTVSTFYTKSYKKIGFNELRFNDKAKEEEIFIHAQKDVTYIVENSITGTLNHGSRKIVLESKPEEKEEDENENKSDNKNNAKSKNENGPQVENSLLIIKGDDKLTIKEGNHEIELEKGNDKLTIKEGNYEIILEKGNISVTASDNISIKASKNIKIEADGEIEILSKKAMKLDSKDILSLKAVKDFSISALSAKFDWKTSFECASLTTKLEAKTTFDIACNATANINAKAMMNISGSGVVAIKGGMIKLN
ncbi:hypothetical protein FACS1894113_1340 [Alphaproteobacteria bacterium]|nr:hypothetical protein FACS1894113_1340 [Alphaproteobacteria bacterium]